MSNEFRVRKGLIVNGSGSVILDIQGSQGELFSVTDSLSGSLFSVNDISGMPILAVTSDDSVKLGTFSKEAIKVSGSIAIITGSLSGTSATASYVNPLNQNVQVTGSTLISGSGGAAYALDVNGSARIQSVNNNGLYLYNTSSLSRFMFNTYIFGGVDAMFIQEWNSSNVFQRNLVAFFTGGNIGINQATDAGYKLDVNGTARMQGNTQVTGSLNVSGSITTTGTITAQTLVVQTITSSIIYSSGSNIFGNSLTNTQTFTGSILTTGSLNVNNVLYVSGSNVGINTTASLAALHIKEATGVVAEGFRISGTGTDYSVIFHDGSSNSYWRTYNGYMYLGTETAGYSTYLRAAGSTVMTLNAANNVGIGTTTPNARLDINGSAIVSGSIAITGSVTSSAMLISGSGTQRLIVVGSGSAQPIFTVQGSQGELFSVTDSLSGSLFSVNDISGLPILEVFSDSTTLVGSYLAPALNTTNKITTTNSGSFTVYSVPTASYDGIFMDYTAKSGSNARAGVFTAIWSGSSVNYMDNSTTDFGNTSLLTFGALISGSNMVVTGSVATGSAWTVKAIIRSI